jgi:hypothetical protein
MQSLRSDFVVVDNVVWRFVIGQRPGRSANWTHPIDIRNITKSL